MATQTGSIDLSTYKSAASNATKYVTDITNGIFVHPENDANNGVQITDSVDIKRNGTSVANFGATARVGAESGAHVNISTSGLEMADGNTPMASLFSSALHLGNGTYDIYVTSTTDEHNVTHHVAHYTVQNNASSVQTKRHEFNGTIYVNDGVFIPSGGFLYLAGEGGQSWAEIASYIPGLVIRTSESDLNLNTETGLYKYTSSNTNLPYSGVGGMMLVLAYNENYIYQFAFANSSSTTNNTTQMRIYSRRYYNGTWYSWYKVTLS